MLLLTCSYETTFSHHRYTFCKDKKRQENNIIEVFSIAKFVLGLQKLGHLFLFESQKAKSVYNLCI